MTIVLAMALLIAAAGPAGHPEGPPEHCQQVRGRYAIYANRDALQVLGSKHLVEVSIEGLDKELQARGWENTSAYGDFTICSLRKAEARALTVRDVVRVVRYGNVRYVQR